MIHLKGVREEHIKYTAELARYSNEVTTTYKETPRSDQENRLELCRYINTGTF
jgi:cytoplasmic FMR1 interacting protein